MLQADDLYITHRHHSNKPGNILGFKAVAFGGDVAHSEFDIAAYGEALRSRHQLFVFGIILDAKKRDFVACNTITILLSNGSAPFSALR